MDRAIGVVRISEVGDREEERLASDKQQVERIEQECRRLGLELLEVLPELDVSGGAPLIKRPGLRRAVEAVEAGRARVVIVAYFDRLVRSLRVQEEVVSRVEAAGGRVLAADFGQVTNGTASQWLSSTMLGMVAEYTRRTTAERTASAQNRAVLAGRPPFPLMPGFRRGKDGTAEIDPKTAPIVRRAFEMRADGVSLRQIHAYLSEHGIKRGSLNSRAMMFRNRMAIGEIHYRGLVGSCPALIEPELFDRVQRACGAPRGRYTKSARLLARLDVLHCGACGGRMSATSKRDRWTTYPFYRCASLNCRRATISAAVVEEYVASEVKRLTADYRGRGSTETGVIRLRATAKNDQRALEAAITAFAGLEAEPTAVARLQELRAARDASQAAAERAARDASALEISAMQDWDLLCHEERRSLVRALFASITIAPGGRGTSRITPVPTATLLQ